MKAWPADVSAAEPLPVMFAASRAAAVSSSSPRPLVAVTADAATFNNFGRFFWAQLHIMTEVDHGPIPVMLMFEGEGNSRDYLIRVLAAADRAWIMAENVEVPFVTVMHDESGYARIVEALGFATAVATLRALGDAVVLDRDDEFDQRIAMTGSVNFHESALRDPETYSAYRRGARYLTEYPPSTSTDARGLYRFFTLLPGVESPIAATFDFRCDGMLRDRLAVLIGRNGVGKSQLVQSLIQGLLRHSEARGLASARAAVIEDTPDFARFIVMSSVASDTYPRAIPAWSGLDYEYVSLVPQQDEGGRKLLWILLDCLRDRAEQGFVFDGEQIGRFELLKLILRRLGFWDDLCIPLLDRLPGVPDVFPMAVTIGGQRYVRLKRLSAEQRSVSITALASPHEPVVVLTDAGRIRRLSSGENAILRFAVVAVSTIETASLVVLEEPETYLHPNYVSQVMIILHELLEATSSVAMVVTHSAYVVREATRQRVNVLTRDEQGTPVFVPTPIQTFGASIDSISQFVFGDGAMPHQFRETLDKWLLANPDMTIERLAGQYATEFTPETMSYLAGRLIEGAAPEVEG